MTPQNLYLFQDRRTLQQQMTHHLLMAKLPIEIWTMIMKFGDVPEKFYRNLMRLDDESLLETCLEVLLTEGPGKFRLKVKEYIDMGHTRSKRKTKKVSSSTPNTPTLSDDNFVTEMEVDSNPTDMDDTIQAQLDTMTAKYTDLKTKFSTLQQENESLKEEIEKLRRNQNESQRETKRQRVVTDDEYCAGETVKAFWRDEDGESWLDATILTVYADGKTCKVKYHVDNGISKLARSWIRKI
ncbi:uncharacterized protein LOC123557061 [Mercenaria mercenaria]|uniref:uncharacterized protein LOC123557061 n=1 Tax=Mercenaria mercenaria TaxID=6596 RepID=UPI00234E6522|nr:uncharacterized protein LOC123557061 [Mercenaria mercenaria]